MSELRECPFCGGEPMALETDWCEPPEISVHCSECNALAPSPEAWNRRADKAARAEAFEEARRVLHIRADLYASGKCIALHGDSPETALRRIADALPLIDETREASRAAADKEEGR